MAYDQMNYKAIKAKALHCNTAYMKSLSSQFIICISNTIPNRKFQMKTVKKVSLANIGPKLKRVLMPLVIIAAAHIKIDIKIIKDKYCIQAGLSICIFRKNA